MIIFHPKTIDENILWENIANQIDEQIINYEVIFSKRIRQPYKIKNKSFEVYLNQVKRIIDDVADFIRGFLPKLSSKRRDFDYVRKKDEFLSKHEYLVRAKIKTNKGDKLLSMSFEQPSFVLIPLVLFKSQNQSLYICDTYNSKISYVIGDPENSKSDDYLVDNAMEELWHVALFPYLVEKENKFLIRGNPVNDKEFKKMLIKEGERLSRLFTFASFDEFKLKKGYENIIGEREIKDRERFFVEEIKNMGIKGVLREVGKCKSFLDLSRRL